MLRREFRPLGIGVSVVEPGEFRSNIVSTFLGRKGDKLVTPYDNSPFRDELRKYFAQLQTTPGEADRLGSLTLFPWRKRSSTHSSRKTRSGGTWWAAAEDTDAVITQVMRLLAQPNQGHEHSLTVISWLSGYARPCRNCSLPSRRLIDAGRPTVGVTRACT